MSEKKVVPVFYDEAGNIISSSQTILRTTPEESPIEEAPKEEAKRIITPPKKLSEDISVDVNDVSVMFNLSKNREEGVKEYFVNFIKGKLRYDEFWALRNISFQVKKGDSLALIGRNGSGKSTLLKTIAGIINPTRGSVKVVGSVAPLIEISGGFDRTLSARENIFLSGTMHGHTKKYMKSKFDEIVEFAEIGNFIDVPLKNFSSGMISRLGFAIATCVSADIVIADEVLAVGDARFRMKCEERVSKLLSGGTTFLLVSHSTAAVKKLCKKAAWIEKGQLKEIGPASIVCDHYTHFIKSMPINATTAKERRMVSE